MYNIISGEDQPEMLRPKSRWCSRLSCAESSCGPRWKKATGAPTVTHVTIVIFLEFFSWGLVATILPEAIKEYFGRNQMWLVLGLMQGLKGLLAFLSAPLIGALSDLWGRKPFLLLTVGCTCLPLPFLLVSNMWWHVIAVAVSGAFAVTFSVVFAYVSDVTLSTERSSAYGQVSATFAASLVISPALGSLLQMLVGNKLVFIISTVVAFVDVLFIYFFVPESLPVTEDGQVTSHKTSAVAYYTNPFAAIRNAFSSPTMAMLGVVVFFSYLAEAGETQCIMLYLENTVHFSKTQMAAYIAILGTLSIIAQTFVLNLLTARFLPKTVIIIGLLFSALQMGVYGVFTNHVVIYLNTVLVAMGTLTYPAVSALVSTTSSPEQQGVVQGMITGIRSLCTGLGPALFGLLFQVAETGDGGGGSSSSLLPGVPFLVGCGSVLISLFVTLTLPDRIGVSNNITPFVVEKPEGKELGGRAASAATIALLVGDDDKAESAF